MHYIVNFFIAVIVGIFAYAASLFVLRAIDMEDKKIINKVIGNA